MENKDFFKKYIHFWYPSLTSKELDGVTEMADNGCGYKDIKKKYPVIKRSRFNQAVAGNPNKEATV